MRILFHGPGLVAFRPVMPLPQINGVQATTTTRIGELHSSYWLTGNRGNLIHAEAPAKILRKHQSQSAYGNIGALHKRFGANYAKRISDNFDAVVISLANFIRPDHDGATLAAAIAGLDDQIKIIVLGAGLQGTAPLSEHLPGNQRLLAVLNERAHVFGLRGHQTAAWLADHGFDRGVVLGCPSLFAHPMSILSLSYDTARAKGADATVMTAGHLRTPQMLEKAPNRRGLDFLEAFKNIPASYVFQDELLGYAPLRDVPGLFNEATGLVHAPTLNAYFREAFGREVNFPRYYFFNEAGAWRQAALHHDVFSGDRFHGGVAALQAGVPAIFLTFDNRVAELTELFGLPSMTIPDFTTLGVAGAIERCLTDDALDAIKTTWRARYQTLVKTLGEHGLRVGNGDALKADL